MRQRRVGARGDDRRKAGPCGTAPAHRHLQLERHLALRSAGQAGLQHGPQRLVGELARSADARDLAGVLDRTQPLQGLGAGHQLPALAQELAQARVLCHREALLVEAQSPVRSLQRAGGALEQVVEHDLALERVGDLFGGLGAIAEVGDEAVRTQPRAPPRSVSIGAVGRDQREPARAGEARQVAQVDGARDEQRVEIALAQAGGHALESLRVRRQERGVAQRPPPSRASPIRASSSRTRSSASR